MLRRLLLILFAVLLAQSAWAGEAATKEKKPEPGTSVDMPFLVAPMSQDGKLIGYAYISAKLVCSSPSACIAVREKLAFIQDAYVRDVNAKPIGLASDPKTVDRDMLNARLTAAAKKIVGAEKVVRMDFGDPKKPTIQFAPLHPSESTAQAAPPADQNAPAQGAADGAAKADGTGKTASSAGATSKPAVKQPQ